MAYLALYRRWRPTSLDELKGQSHVRNAIKRSVQEGKIGHAYLFAGPRGTGKTSTAKILAKVLNCLNPKDGEPCGECESCKKIDNNASMDVFEIDAASNRGIDEIRDLRETVKFAPVDGKYKVYIIDEVHMLTAEAFNALLKTLEEPPNFVVFILATTEAYKVPATIQSRCQRYDFRRISVDDIKARLRYVSDEMKFEAEDEAVSLIATHADGGLRDALSLLDQCAAISGGNIKKSDVENILGLVGNAWTSELALAIGERNTQKVLFMIDEITKKGKELTQIINELALCLRTVMIYEAAGNLNNSLMLYNVSDENLEKLKNLFSSERIISALKKLNETAYALRWTNAPRITVEVALLSVCYGETAAISDNSSVADDARISRLETMVRELSFKLQNREFAKTEISSAKSDIGEQLVEKTEDKTNKIEEMKTVKSDDLKNKSDKPQEVSGVLNTELSVKKPVEMVQPIKSADASNLWESVLAHLEQTGSRNVLVCLKQGVCTGVTESAIILSFPSEMLSSIASKMYKKLIEDAVKKVSGKSLSLITESAKKSKTSSKIADVASKLSTVAPATDNKENAKIKTEEKPVIQKKEVLKVEAKEDNRVGEFLKAKSPDLSKLSEEERINLKKATDILGDDFVPAVNVKKIKLAESASDSVKPETRNIPITHDYDFVDEPDFSDIPPPDMDFM